MVKVCRIIDVIFFSSVKYRSEEPPQYPADDNRVPETEEAFTIGSEDPEEQVRHYRLWPSLGREGGRAKK